MPKSSPSSFPKFSKAHFDYLAETIRSSLDQLSENQQMHVATRFAKDLEPTNANFDFDRFVTAATKPESDA